MDGSLGTLIVAGRVKVAGVQSQVILSHSCGKIMEPRSSTLRCLRERISNTRPLNSSFSDARIAPPPHDLGRLREVR